MKSMPLFVGWLFLTFMTSATAISEGTFDRAMAYGASASVLGCLWCAVKLKEDEDSQ